MSADQAAAGAPPPARTPRTRLPHDARRTIVIDAAAKLIAIQGYDGTSVDQVVRAAGLKKGGIYNYISTKLDLLAEIHDRCMHPTLAAARSACSQHDDPAQRLRAIAHVFMQTMVEYNYHIRVVLHEWRRMTDHPRWDELRADRKALEDLVIATLVEGADRGHFRRSDHKIGALTFIGMLNYSYVWLSPERTTLDDVRAIAEDMVDTFLQGYAVR